MLSCDIKWLSIVFSVRFTNASPLMVDNSIVIKINSVIYIFQGENLRHDHVLIMVNIFSTKGK